MHFSTLLLGAAAAALLALGEELRPSGVPSECSTICGPIVKLSNTCDIDPEEITSDDDDECDGSDEAVESHCICANTSFDVANIMALCASCLSQTGGDTEDADRIMSQCGFSSATYSPAATTAVQGIALQATKPAEPTETSNVESRAGKVVVDAVAVLSVSAALLVMF